MGQVKTMAGGPGHHMEWLNQASGLRQTYIWQSGHGPALSRSHRSPSGLLSSRAFAIRLRSSNVSMPRF